MLLLLLVVLVLLLQLLNTYFEHFAVCKYMNVCFMFFMIRKAFVFQTEHSVQCIRDPKFCNVFQWGIFLYTYLISYIHCMAIHAACVRIFNIFSSNNCNPEHKFHIMPPSRYKTHDTFFFYSFWQSTVVVHNLAHKPNSSTLYPTMLCPFRFHSVSIQISHFLLFDNRNVALHHPIDGARVC